MNRLEMNWLYKIITKSSMPKLTLIPRSMMYRHISVNYILIVFFYGFFCIFHNPQKHFCNTEYVFV